MKLLELQRTMARAVMQPLTFTERMQRTAPDGQPMRAYAARFIKPNDRLTSFERLEIYNRQYWFRLLSSMVEDFPGLRAVLGAARFEAMSKAYITDCPSRSSRCAILARSSNPGCAIPAGPEKTSPGSRHRETRVGGNRRLRRQAEPPLRPEDLGAAAGPNLRLRLQPYIHLLSLRYPVDDLLLEIKKNDDDNDFASNAMQERRKRKRVQHVAKLKPAAIALAVHRIDNSVYFRRLEPEEFALLSALHQGKTLQKSVDLAFRGSKISPEELPGTIQRWFHNWAALGWFCKAEEKSPRSRNRAAKRKRG